MTKPERCRRMTRISNGVLSDKTKLKNNLLHISSVILAVFLLVCTNLMTAANAVDFDCTPIEPEVYDLEGNIVPY
jgi:nitroreductase